MLIKNLGTGSHTTVSIFEVTRQTHPHVHTYALIALTMHEVELETLWAYSDTTVNTFDIASQTRPHTL